jgi:prepilin-type N-terminal cleavage/methylation domain-containing protein
MKWEHSCFSPGNKQWGQWGHSSLSPADTPERLRKINGDIPDYRCAIIRNVPVFVRTAGFTLAELLIVIVIIGVVAVTALPEFSSRDTARLDLAAAEVADAFRFARHESVRTGVPRGVRFIINSDHVRVFRMDMGPNPPTKLFDIYHPVAKHLYDTQAEWRLPRGVAVDARSLVFDGACNKTKAIAFDLRGNPICTDPVSTRVQSATFTLELDGTTRDIKVEQITGRVTVQ